MLCSLGCLGVVGPAEGVVIRVPADAASILAAVDLAAAGDSILVAPGTWTDHETRSVPFTGGPQPITSNAFVRRAMTIVAEGGPEVTTIVGSADAAILRDAILITQAPGAVILEGFTITGPEVGVLIGESAPVTIRNCRVVDSGVGALVRDTDLLVEDCVFSGNMGTVSDAIASAIDGAFGTYTVLRTEFAGNQSKVCVSVRSDPPLPDRAVIRDCVFHDNRASGAFLNRVPTVIVENNSFLRNAVSQGNGGGLHVQQCGGDVQFNTFAWDSILVLGSGGGLRVGESSVDVNGNTFYGCHHPGPDGGAAVTANSAVPFQFRNNIIASSTGTSALRNFGTYVPTDGCNYYWANEFFSTTHWPPAPTDVFGGPKFCDPLLGDFELMSDSPCAAENNPLCGQVGAYGIGCETIGVAAKSWAEIKSSYRVEGGER